MAVTSRVMFDPESLLRSPMTNVPGALTDRVAALRGALELESPPGGGTNLRARVPPA